MANLELDPLDDTRVHPRDYELAIEIASSAVGGDASAKEVAVENALAQPKEVTALQLNAYATHLDEQQNKPNMLARLIDIQFEFVAPYGELRFRSQQLKVGRRDATPARHKIVGLASRSYVPTRPPPPAPGVQPEDSFALCLGESRTTLKPGRKVRAVQSSARACACTSTSSACLCGPPHAGGGARALCGH